MKADKIVGEYYDGVYYDIVEESTDTGTEYILKLRMEQTDEFGNLVEARGDIPKVLKFPWERAVILLSNPWDKIRHYSDDKGEHYNCIVYDFIWVDVWAENIEELFNLIASLIYPGDDDIDVLTDSLKRKEESSDKSTNTDKAEK